MQQRCALEDRQPDLEARLGHGRVTVNVVPDAEESSDGVALEAASVWVRPGVQLNRTNLVLRKLLINGGCSYRTLRNSSSRSALLPDNSPELILQQTLHDVMHADTCGVDQRDASL